MLSRLVGRGCRADLVVLANLLSQQLQGMHLPGSCMSAVVIKMERTDGAVGWLQSKVRVTIWSSSWLVPTPSFPPLPPISKSVDLLAWNRAASL